jgi:hypothetical protein
LPNHHHHQPNATQQTPDISNVKTGFICGPAGSGKTHLIRQQLQDNPKWGLLTATTGVAAHVLGPDVPTVHSALGFFDSKDAVKKLTSKSKPLLKNVKHFKEQGYERIIVDECSMIPREMFEVIADTCEQAGMGLVLVGDFCQLAPMDKNGSAGIPWLFKSSYWKKFEENTVKVTTQYRQTDKEFLAGLNAPRAGDGAKGEGHLLEAGVEITEIPRRWKDDVLDGLVLVATNKAKDSINKDRYEGLSTDEITFKTERTGEQRQEWNDIPDSISLKVGSRVMVTRNLYDKANGHKLLPANGDLGTVVDMTSNTVTVRRDDGHVIEVQMFTVDNAERELTYSKNGRRRSRRKQKPTGSITYMPLQLA